MNSRVTDPVTETIHDEEVVVKTTSRPVTVRVPLELYKRAIILAGVEGTTLRSLVESGLEQVVEERFDRGGTSLAKAVDAVREYREGIAG